MHPLLEVAYLLASLLADECIRVVPGLLDDLEVLSLLNFEPLRQLLVLARERLHVLRLPLHLRLLRPQLPLHLPLNRLVLQEQWTKQVAAEHARHSRCTLRLSLQVEGLLPASELVLSELGGEPLDDELEVSDLVCLPLLAHRGGRVEVLLRDGARKVAKDEGRRVQLHDSLQDGRPVFLQGREELLLEVLRGEAWLGGRGRQADHRGAQEGLGLVGRHGSNQERALFLRSNAHFKFY